MRLRDFLGGAPASRCMVLVGEAGIGKTSLWEEGLRLADDLGCIVLAARASPAEASLSFAALGDLVGGIRPEVLAGVPPPQLHALQVALRLTDPSGGPPDPMAIGAGFLSA